eukprot:ANDGO_00750.mRNA.1 hypothetical protein
MDIWSLDGIGLRNFVFNSPKLPSLRVGYSVLLRDTGNVDKESLIAVYESEYVSYSLHPSWYPFSLRKAVLQVPELAMSHTKPIANVVVRFYVLENGGCNSEFLSVELSFPRDLFIISPSDLHIPGLPFNFPLFHLSDGSVAVPRKSIPESFAVMYKELNADEQAFPRSRASRRTQMLNTLENATVAMKKCSTLSAALSQLWGEVRETESKCKELTSVGILRQRRDVVQSRVQTLRDKIRAKQEALCEQNGHRRDSCSAMSAQVALLRSQYVTLEQQVQARYFSFINSLGALLRIRDVCGYLDSLLKRVRIGDENADLPLSDLLSVLAHFSFVCLRFFGPELGPEFSVRLRGSHSSICIAQSRMSVSDGPFVLHEFPLFVSRSTELSRVHIGLRMLSLFLQRLHKVLVREFCYVDDAGFGTLISVLNRHSDQRFSANVSIPIQP